MDTPRREPRRWLWVLAACAVVGAAFPIVYAVRAEHPAPAAASAEAAPERPPDGVACLGRIQPEGGVIHVAAPSILGRPPAVEALDVHENQRVFRGALLATLAGREQLKLALDQAHAQTAVAQRRLEQVRAGTKESDRAAQRAEIARLSAELDDARSELQRYEVLRGTDDVTASELDARRTAERTAEHAVEEARRRLESLSEVPASDVRLAEAQLASAQADEQRARSEFELGEVRAPCDGQVLKVHAHAGEEIGAQGLLEIADLTRMDVVAEVYETDIARVRLGQRATISGDLLQHPLAGTVVRLGREVKAASVLPGDPAAFSDNRIVEVRIRLDRVDAVTGLIDGKVNVVIQP